ncbi:TraB/GumN family protein [Candidatus Woesearchaeota archaeon]|nr:TraB/GumN family protein [Candidatus Woesearchaeota archaeon]
MFRQGNISIIGTSHISEDSLRAVRREFSENGPGIVAIELDYRRLHALLSNVEPRVRLSDARRIGIKGYLFALLGSWIQRKLGEHVGVAPGSEMRLAVELARDSGARIALIDRDIEVTLRRFSQEFTWREKLRLLREIFLSPFSRRERIDLAKVPEKRLVRRLMADVRESFPGLYRALVSERDEHMASRLKSLMAEFPEERILAVVGAGHEDGIVALMRKSGR